MNPNLEFLESNNQESRCPISLDTFENSKVQDTMVTKCKHKFHVSCFLHAKTYKCPYCST